MNKAPKYGNDDDRVDQVARGLGEHCCKEVLKHRHITGQKLKPGLFSFLNFLESGQKCIAFPSGRKAFEPFTNGISPMHGMDRNGPTAMLSSASKLNYLLSPNGNALDLKLPVYTLSSDDLEAAKKHPEKHASLIIRVTGYSAFFITLDKKMQDEIIERTKSFSI